MAPRQPLRRVNSQSAIVRGESFGRRHSAAFVGVSSMVNEDSRGSALRKRGPYLGARDSTAEAAENAEDGPAHWCAGRGVGRDNARGRKQEKGGRTKGDPGGEEAKSSCYRAVKGARCREM